MMDTQTPESTAGDILATLCANAQEGRIRKATIIAKQHGCTARKVRAIAERYESVIDMCVALGTELRGFRQRAFQAAVMAPLPTKEQWERADKRSMEHWMKMEEMCEYNPAKEAKDLEAAKAIVPVMDAGEHSLFTAMVKQFNESRKL